MNRDAKETSKFQHSIQPSLGLWEAEKGELEKVTRGNQNRHVAIEKKRCVL